MNKKLTPLQAFENIIVDLTPHLKNANTEEIKIVETELKESSELRTRHYELLKESEQFYNERNKYKKALEIIKEKKWLVEDILNVFIENKEKYDLLKEILKDE